MIQKNRNELDFSSDHTKIVFLRGFTPENLNLSESVFGES